MGMEDGLSMFSWLNKPGCSDCAAKDERIVGLLAEVSALMDVRAASAKLEELARLEERRDLLVTQIENLRLKHRAEEKAKREVPGWVVGGRMEGGWPRL